MLFRNRMSLAHRLDRDTTAWRLHLLTWNLQGFIMSLLKIPEYPQLSTIHIVKTCKQSLNLEEGLLPGLLNKGSVELLQQTPLHHALVKTL